jgi:hypothetical protein
VRDEEVREERARIAILQMWPKMHTGITGLLPSRRIKNM